MQDLLEENRKLLQGEWLVTGTEPMLGPRSEGLVWSKKNCHLPHWPQESSEDGSTTFDGFRAM
jgi:hypothetical protein